jgi:hypothetical protein
VIFLREQEISSGNREGKRKVAALGRKTRARVCREASVGIL